MLAAGSVVRGTGGRRGGEGVWGWRRAMCGWRLLVACRWLGRRSFTSQTVASSCASLTHTVGIIAHIDAGKTTTTERMLYYSGVTRRLGSVDSGSTVMDYLPPERERGITINSAAISFTWHGHSVSLIDTPGHVDFTFEVQRSLSVLDGAVLLLDASVGVEAQTVTVWKQARSYKIPCVVFINKMDKPRASLPSTVASLQRGLGVTALVTQLPLGQGQALRGVLDLVHCRVLSWEGGDGASYTTTDLETLAEEVRETAWRSREELVEQVATLDDELAAVVLKDTFDLRTLSPALLQEAVRRVVVGGAAVPVLCGSALKNTAIQPLMDAVVTYLPSARETRLQVPSAARELYAYVFKLSHDAHRGMLAFLRIYAGTLHTNMALYNYTQDTRERVSHLLLPLAGELYEVPQVLAGNIAVATGLKHTSTGDVLVQSAAAAKSLQKEEREEREEREEPQSSPTTVTVPPPVFFCTVEPMSAADQKALDVALASISREDPSLRVSLDNDTGQTVLSGMGELHLEVTQERLQRVYGVACQLGQLQVAYREAPFSSYTITDTLRRKLGHDANSATVTLSLGPASSHINTAPEVTFDLSLEGSTRVALMEAVEGACAHGPLLGFPVLGVAVSIESVSAESSSLPLLSSCVCQCVHKALLEVEMILLEPVTDLEVSVPEEHVGCVLSELTGIRRAQVLEVGEEGVGKERAKEKWEERKTVKALAPLEALLGYASALRSMTSGTGSFSALFSHYQPLDKRRQTALLHQLRGY